MGRRVFADVLKILKMRPPGVRLNLKCDDRFFTRIRKRNREEGRVMTEAETGGDAATSRGSQGLRKLEKTGGPHLHPKASRGLELGLPSGLQNCERITSCCSEPPSVVMVTAPATLGQVFSRTVVRASTEEFPGQVSPRRLVFP